MQELILVKGLPGSGKSTWAKALMESKPNVYKRVCKDSLRAMLDFDAFTGKSEDYILKTRDNLIIQALQNSFSVIIDDTNLNPIHETHIRQLVKNFNIKFTVKFIDTDKDVCIANDLKRLNSVGYKEIIGMYNKWLKPAAFIVKHNPKLPYCIIIDIDGTVALKGDRGMFEWDKVGVDLPNEPIIELINNYITETQDTQMIFVTGRDECCREETKKWLNKNLYWDFTLFMRPKGDFRKDLVIKREIYENEILNKYNVNFVLDDRDCIVEQWRDMGLTCLQVAEGDF